MGSLQFLFVRSWMNTLGVSDHELEMVFPGDSLVPDPDLLTTRAITIQAPLSDVWPWLVQIGQGRGGFYSYELLENMVGCDIHNADEILPEYQNLEKGDSIRLHPDSPPLQVVDIENNHYFILGGRIDTQTADILPIDQAGSPDHMAATWAFMVYPKDENSTRLITRFRLAGKSGLLTWIAYRFIFEPVTFIMERKMLLGIRQRAENYRISN
jgi:hypothetical protein